MAGGNSYAPDVQGRVQADYARIESVLAARAAALEAGRTHARLDAAQRRFTRADVLRRVGEGLAAAFVAGYTRGAGENGIGDQE